MRSGLIVQIVVRKPLSASYILGRWLVAKSRLFIVRSRMGFENFPSDLHLSRGTRISVTDGGKSIFGRGIIVDRNATIIVKHGELRVGDNVYLGIGTVVCAVKSIVIGDNVLVAEYVTIRDQDHAIGPSERVAAHKFTQSSVNIGNNVWIGAKATITKGVTIGDNTVIGAGAVVTRNIPSNCVALGVPAKVVQQIGTSVS